MAEKPSSLLIRDAGSSDYEEAMSLAWRVFLHYEAPDYEQEGVDNFCEFLTDPMLRKMFEQGEYKIFVAMEGKEMLGMASLRSGNLISLLFVEGERHRQGIGRRLVEELARFVRTNGRRHRTLRVYAAPYAVGFYRHLGFYPVSEEIRMAGIRYTEMEYEL